MNQKITRITLIIPTVTILIFIGVAAAININNHNFKSSDNLNFKSEGVSGIQACSCLGNTYSDDVPPVVIVKSPPNNSLILVDTIIYIEASDNFPAMDGGVPFVPEYVWYHWNGTESNTTGYNAAVDEAPDDNGPVKIEIALPNDEAGVTHILYVYAVDYENNWISVVFVFSTQKSSEVTTTIFTTTSTTTTTTTTNSTTVSTSTEVSTEESSDTTTTSIPSLNITTGFSIYVLILFLMVLVPIKRRN